MTITIEIPDEELKAAVLAEVSDRIAKNIHSGYHEGRLYMKDIKEIVREIIKSDIDNLSERAVNAAAKSIENKAIKKTLDKMFEDG